MNRHFRPILTIFSLGMLATSLAMGQGYARIPAGTSLQVRVTDSISSETATVGQIFHGTLASPLTAEGRTFPKGAAVTGEVVDLERSGRLSNPGELHLALRTIRTGGSTYAVATRTLVLKGDSHTKSNVTKIGGGTAVGALIGAIAGGGKGAAIGAGVGAAAGTGVAAATGKKAAEVPSEAVLAWTADSPPSFARTQDSGSRSYFSQNDAEHHEHHEKHGNSRNDEEQGYGEQGPSGFSEREKRIISDCFSNDRAGLPPGLAKKDRLPPGLEKQLQRNGTLPPGLQKKVQPLPGSCTAQLPHLPGDWARVVLSGRVILLDAKQRIVDLFWLDRD